jgi:FkbM family methyltransferase
LWSESSNAKVFSDDFERTTALMLRRPSRVTSRLRAWSLRLFDLLENNNEERATRNGESALVEAVLRSCAAHTVDRPVIFDVGANAGDYTALVLDRARTLGVAPAIHAFEPLRATFEGLAARMAHEPQVTLNRVALSDRTGTATLHFAAAVGSQASLARRDLRYLGLDQTLEEPVACTTAAAYLSQKDLAHIHLLKLDVEGHELQVLRGLGERLSPKVIDFIQFEYGGTTLDAGTSLRDLYRLLEGAGFRVAKLMRHSLELRPYAHALDNFRYQNFVAASEDLLKRLR